MTFGRSKNTLEQGGLVVEITCRDKWPLTISISFLGRELIELSSGQLLQSDSGIVDGYWLIAEH